MLQIFAAILLELALANPNKAPEPPPLWEYGLGIGYIKYQQYPASEQSKHLFLAFPTFQYRGDILRADDRDGARALLFKHNNLSLEFSGGVLPAVSGDDNKARQGMEPLLWGVQLGPQLNYKASRQLKIKLGIYQSFQTDITRTKTNGFLLENKSEYLLMNWFPNAFGFLGLTLKGGSKEFLSTYFDVTNQYANSERTEYEARAGFLSYEFSYFHVIHSGRASFYAGVSDTHYNLSANRASPLHKSDHNFTFFGGITYVLGESERDEKSMEKSRGLFTKIRLGQDLEQSP